jgi:methylated-DNA-protein-cysteine methyltransferase-like protein
VVPCHRVVFTTGELASGFAFGGREAQASLLEGEGVCVRDGTDVDLSRFGWNPGDGELAVLHDALSHLK